MTALALAAALVLAGKCAPQVAPETLLSIARVESAMNPLAVHDNTTGETVRPADLPSASILAATLIQKGHSVDLGLMQVNSSNLKKLNLSVLSAFDACESLRAGATILQQAYAGGLSLSEQQRALRVALSRYNTGGPDKGFANGYVRRVEIAAEYTVPAIRTGAVTDQAASPPQNSSAPGWDVWGEESAPDTSPAHANTQPTGDQKAAPVPLHPNLVKRAS